MWALAVLAAACSGKISREKSTEDTENLLSAASAYTAAAEKETAARALEEDWSRFAATLPMEIEQQRQRPQGRRPADSAEALWSKAQAAFAAGNLHEAVSTAKIASDALNPP